MNVKDITTEANYARQKLGYLPNILHPRTFNEHLLNNKFFLRDELLITTTDKVTVQEYVKNLGYEDLLIPNYYITKHPVTIPFDKLPERYIIKPNQLSGSLMVVNKPENSKKIIETCRQWMEVTHYGASRFVWFTQFIKPRIIVQKLITDNPIDYKFHIFKGRCEFIGVHNANKIGGLPRYNISYDRDWNILPFRFQQALGKPVPKPSHLKDMIHISERLAKPFHYVRVDLYNIDGQIYFGELTHLPNSGSGRFDPQIYDFKYGELW